jgi:chromosome segregation ATPase
MSYFGGGHRYVCEALEEMRKQVDALSMDNITRYVAMTKMMIEEIQTHVNHMENALHDGRDYVKMREKKKKLKKQLKKLESEIEKLEETIDKPKNDVDIRVTTLDRLMGDIG